MTVRKPLLSPRLRDECLNEYIGRGNVKCHSIGRRRTGDFDGFQKLRLGGLRPL
jgi:hypothetical protein